MLWWRFNKPGETRFSTIVGDFLCKVGNLKPVRNIDFGQSLPVMKGKVVLIFGAEVYPQILPNEIRKGILLIQRSYLGWTLSSSLTDNR